MTNAVFKIIPGEYVNCDAIDNTIKYLYRLNKKKALPLYCYGVFPPTYENLIQAFHETRRLMQTNILNQQVWHFTISFELALPQITRTNYHFADGIAKLYAPEYQVCYAYHTNTHHPHFHYIVSTTSYIPGNEPLSVDKMNLQITQMIQLATEYEIILEQKE